MRGEDTRQRIMSSLRLETPPHAWGRRKERLSFKQELGNTPTCVGKTTAQTLRYRSSWKHPHMRGEDRMKSFRSEQITETPPHAWGRLYWIQDTGLSDGNTPTCVGKTPSGSRCTSRHRKHPHMRGEDRIYTDLTRWQIETPPHAWGRLPRLSDTCVKSGNTPTCVGKTHVKHEGPLLVRKHPHMRGEDLKGLLDMRDCKETPPHAWGRHPQVTHEHQPCGNTPTCVGKTLVLKIRHNTLQKHPHMRGEDTPCRCWWRCSGETPPHAWGRP